MEGYGLDAWKERYNEWAIKAYNEAIKTKTISREKYERIVRTLKGMIRNSAENSKFRFWMRTKGFKFDDTNNNKLIVTTPSGSVKQVAVVEEFFDIIHSVHIEQGAKTGTHAGQKRTYRAVTESYAFLPREAVTQFLLGCSECQHRGDTDHSPAVMDLSPQSESNNEGRENKENSYMSVNLAAGNGRMVRVRIPKSLCGSVPTADTHYPGSSTACSSILPRVTILPELSATDLTCPTAIVPRISVQPELRGEPCLTTESSHARNKRKRPNHLVHRNLTSTPKKWRDDVSSSSSGEECKTTEKIQTISGNWTDEEVSAENRRVSSSSGDTRDLTPISDSEEEPWKCKSRINRIPLNIPQPRAIKDLRDAIVKCELDDENGLISRNGDKDLDEDMWPYGPSLCKKPSTPSRDLSSPVRAEETGSAHDETSSSGHKDDDDDDEEDSDDLKAIPHDTERLKAFNMFVRLFVDENLDRQVPISKQPKEKIQAIIDSCTRQFPEFGDRARKRIRTYLKSCRRNKKARDSSSWPESNRPTPAHLTSVQAEQILAQACENESHNAKRMRLGLEPVSQPMPILPNNCEPARTLMDHFSPANLTSVADIKLNNNNNKPESPNCHLKTSLHHDLTKTVNSTASTMSTSPANGGFRGNSSPAFPGAHGFTSTPIFSGYPQPTVHNGPTDLSMKSVKPILSHKLNPTEIAAVRQLITGYRESAAFLLRSADELEQLLIQQQ